MTTLSRSTLLLAALLAVSTASYAASAVEPSSPPAREGAAERQQDKMKRCNAEAGRKELKGADRRAFMSACLRG